MAPLTLFGHGEQLMQLIELVILVYQHGWSKTNVTAPIFGSFHEVDYAASVTVWHDH